MRRDKCRPFGKNRKHRPDFIIKNLQSLLHESPANLREFKRRQDDAVSFVLQFIKLQDHVDFIYMHCLFHHNKPI